MKKYILPGLLGVLFWTLASVAPAAQVVNRVVAVVNGEIITYQDLLQHTALVTGQTADQTLVDRIGAQVLETMIDDLILRQEAQRLKIEISDAEVDKEIEQIKARRQLSNEEFERSLSMQGLSVVQFRERTRQEITKHQILNYMVRRKVVVTQEEIDAYFKEHHAELGQERSLGIQILVVGDADQAQSLWAQVEKGDISFDAAVTKYSVGPQADNGVLNDVRWRELDEPWRVALRDLPVDGQTKPFPIQDKWIMVKLLENKVGEPREKAALEDEARDALMRPKLEERFDEYMSGLRSKAVIDKRL